MPLKSQAQAAYLKHNEPEVYKEFASKTPKGTKLPKKATQRQEAIKRAAK